MEPTELKELPQTEKEWQTALSKHGATGDRYELSSASSASKIEVGEFLALRTLWVENDLRTLQESHKNFGLEDSHAKETYKILKSSTPGWREYLKCIEDNTATKRGKPLPTETASFATVLHNQREILERPSSKNDEPKFYRSPIRLRPREPSKAFLPQTPQRAVPQPFGTPFDVPSPI